MGDLAATSEVHATLGTFGLSSFSTKQFVERFRVAYPAAYKVVTDEYGVGGRGSGKPYSANVHFARVLDHLYNNGMIEKLDYRPAPPDWGNRIIRYWSLGQASEGDTIFPDEATNEYEEGEKTTVEVNKHERNQEARQKCIEAHGLDCKGCGINFEQAYGSRGAGFIHVHHLMPISQRSAPYKVNPVNDLIPVYPNCHAMIHRRTPYLSLVELKQILAGDKIVV